MAVIWLTKKSKHYLFHFYPSSLAEKEIDKIITSQESEYQKILDFLEVDNNRIINYFLYPDNKIKGELTDNDGNGHAVWDKYEVHAVYNDDTKCIGAHEDTHLLSLPLGYSVKLFREGLAEYMCGAWHKKPHDWWAKKFQDENKLPDFCIVLDNDCWDEFDDTISYPCAGSFATFLIKQMGKKQYFKLYGSLERYGTTKENLNVFEKLAGKPLNKMQKEWEENLKHGK